MGKGKKKVMSEGKKVKGETHGTHIVQTIGAAETCITHPIHQQQCITPIYY
jgi:hypothetical protein